MMLWPWQPQESQLRILAATGVSLRQPGTMPGVWIVEVEDAETAARLSRVAVWRLPSTAAGCVPSPSRA
ncbi:hypothetical protein [Niveispirillum sp. BGYR6]|uniref:hypothetical protein n=1 Tax=Niveispirillum sp. BGYR6 TaxID=2971249 RepID=UPI0022B954A9|nr:hypothetical protein [Niveispirillum sp. BGYR6]MDG5495846.1 hypothetical protein [Niveispirillum sp. BGYR6]